VLCFLNTHIEQGKVETADYASLINIVEKPGPVAHRLEALTADQKVRSPLGPKQSEAIFSVHLNRQDCSGGSES
jgi:hypothetical protein